MKKWIKHTKDTVSCRQCTFAKQNFEVSSVSRHRKDGVFQGYIVKVATEQKHLLCFKRYRHRDIAELSAMSDFCIFNRILLY
jgi:hypothetical protein